MTAEKWIRDIKLPVTLSPRPRGSRMFNKW